MRRIPLLLVICFIFSLAFQPAWAQSAASSEATEIVARAVAYWRGQSSEMLAEMTVTRPDWNRVSRLRSWTMGSDHSLVRFIEPKKDAGNASLTRAEESWTFSPKTNRAIKIPASMKGQSWMGSDFSYQDLSRDDEIVHQYSHALLATELVNGQKVFTIEALPIDGAPVVWGREVLKIREDRIILQHTFYDQDGRAVKQLTASEIGTLGGKLYPTVLRMSNLETDSEWTEVRYLEANFGIALEDSFFSVGNLSQ